MPNDPLDHVVCPDCGSKNWHNIWLCRECGYPDQKAWQSHVRRGYVKPRTKAGKARAAKVLKIAR